MPLTRTARATALAILAVGWLTAGAAAGAERAEDVDKFAKWAAPGEDPVLCRLKLTDKQKQKFLDLHAGYAKQKAKIVAKYKDVKMVMARRGMYRELMQLEAGAEQEFPKVLTAAQRAKIKTAEGIMANCEAQIAKIKAELEKRQTWARSNPGAYAEFKKRCDGAIKTWTDDRDRKLDQFVGEKPAAGAGTQKKPGKIKLDEAGVYRSGKWEYRLKVEKKAGKVVYRSGSLNRDGKSQHLVKPGTVLETPWGKMKKLPGKAKAEGDQGWLPTGK
jgi:hypothetical protein